MRLTETLERATAGLERAAPSVDDSEGRRALGAHVRAALVREVTERRLKAIASVCAGLFLVEAALCAWFATSASSGIAIVSVNATVKSLVFTAICVLVARDARFGRLLTVVIAGEAAAAVGLTLTVTIGERIFPDVGGLGAHPGLGWLWIAASAAIAVALGWARLAAGRAVLGLAYLSALEFETIAAIAEVTVDPLTLSGPDVARNVDNYLASFRSSRKADVRAMLLTVALRPLLRLRPPLPLMEWRERSSLIEGVEKGSAEPGSLGRFGWAVRVALRLVHLAFYGDPRTRALIAPAQRPGPPADSLTAGRRLACASPADVDAEIVNADIAIVGSGPAACVIAQQIAARSDRHVLMLERGRYVDPGDRGTDELYRRAAMLEDGGLEQILDHSIRGAAASCVGGGAGVTDVPLMRPPHEVLERWTELGPLPNADTFTRAFKRVLELVAPQIEAAPALVRPGLVPDRQLADGLAPPRPTPRLERLNADAKETWSSDRGDGTTRSPLAGVLSEMSDEQLVILTECTAERIEVRDGRAVAVQTRLADGRRLRVTAKDVVVAAGAPQSSLLLRRSGIRSAGTHCLSYVLGSRLVAEFPDTVSLGPHVPRAWRFSDFLLLAERLSPATMALILTARPSRHLTTMLRFTHLSTLTALVAVRSDGARPNIDDPSILGMRDGLRLAAEALFDDGAIRVMPPTLQYEEYDSRAALDRLRPTGPPLDFTVAYPLGGNALSADAEQGVVDPSFRVHGYENLVLCDASVLPTSLPVLPQLTVMALAFEAARHVVDA
jgi:hypothetical protein